MQDYKGDHKDRNKLNNTRGNLRKVTWQQNRFNSSKTSRNNTGYKGVSYESTRHKYRAVICVSGVDRTLGRFDTAEEAALAYNKAAMIYHGEFAVLNEVSK